jgi:hypothetical protein
MRLVMMCVEMEKLVGRRMHRQQEATKEDAKSEPEAVVAPNTGEDEQVVLEAVIRSSSGRVLCRRRSRRNYDYYYGVFSVPGAGWSSSKAKTQSIRGMSFS